jgi:hypothetical protein
MRASRWETFGRDEQLSAGGRVSTTMWPYRSRSCAPIRHPFEVAHGLLTMATRDIDVAQSDANRPAVVGTLTADTVGSAA